MMIKIFFIILCILLQKQGIANNKLQHQKLIVIANPYFAITADLIKDKKTTLVKLFTNNDLDFKSSYNNYSTILFLGKCDFGEIKDKIIHIYQDFFTSQEMENIIELSKNNNIYIYITKSNADYLSSLYYNIYHSVLNNKKIVLNVGLQNLKKIYTKEDNSDKGVLKILLSSDLILLLGDSEMVSEGKLNDDLMQKGLGKNCLNNDVNIIKKASIVVLKSLLTSNYSNNKVILNNIIQLIKSNELILEITMYVDKNQQHLIDEFEFNNIKFVNIDGILHDLQNMNQNMANLTKICSNLNQESVLTAFNTKVLSFSTNDSIYDNRYLEDFVKYEYCQPMLNIIKKNWHIN